MIENPRLFFLALAAITECNMERFRYEPMIRPPPTMTSPTVGPPLHLDGWEIHIDHGIDADNILVPGVAKMKITGDPLYVQPGIVGRGTSVIPVTVIPGHEFAGLKAEKKLVVKFSWPAASRVDSEDGLLRRICKRIGAKEARHITPMRLSTTSNLAPVFCLISSSVTPGASSVRVSFPAFRSTSKTHCVDGRRQVRYRYIVER